MKFKEVINVPHVDLLFFPIHIIPSLFLGNRNQWSRGAEQRRGEKTTKILHATSLEKEVFHKNHTHYELSISSSHIEKIDKRKTKQNKINIKSEYATWHGNVACIFITVLLDAFHTSKLRYEQQRKWMQSNGKLLKIKTTEN